MSFLPALLKIMAAETEFAPFPNVKIGPAALQGSAMVPESLAPTRSGHTTVQAVRPDGRAVNLHSRYDPVREARKQVEDVSFDLLDTLLVFGCGLGFGVMALAKRLGAGNHLVVVERDAGIFREALKNPEFQAVVRRPRTFFFVGIEPDDLYDFLTAHMTLFLASGLKIVRHPHAIALYPDYYEGFLQRIDDFIRTGAVLLRTTMYLSRVSFTNRLKNLKAYVESPGVKAYKDRFKGKPGIVVSAGPSLTRNMALLKQVKGKAPIVAVSTALKSLLGADIQPDFAVVIDYSSLSVRYFEDVPNAERIPLVCDLKSNPGAVNAYQGPKLFDDDELINVLMNGISAPKGKSGSGSTVAHTAYHFLCYMGCDPVIFVGQDLAYTDGELHVPGTAVYQQSLGEFNRFYTPAMKELEYYMTMRPRLRTVPAWAGGEVETCDIFSTYIEEFEGFFRKRPQRVIDATEGGAAKRWTEPMPLSEVIAQFIPEALPEAMFAIPALTPEERRDRMGRAKAQVQSVLGQAHKLQGLYRKAIRLIRRVMAENRQGRAADAIVQEVLDVKASLRQYGALYFVLTQLAQSDLFIRQRQDRALDHQGLTGVDKQGQQAERDLAYLLGLKNALTHMVEEITACGFLSPGEIKKARQSKQQRKGKS